MNFQIQLILGRDFTNAVLLPPKTIRANSFGSYTASYAGSYHIRDMGGHFQDYVVRPVAGRLVGARFHPGFPSNMSFQALDTKTRSPGVTGNIGEAICGILALGRLGLQRKDVVHIKLSLIHI